MARCKKNHTFGEWLPLRYEWGKGDIVMTENEIKKKQKLYLKEKEEKDVYYYFSNIRWERKCTKCKKKDYMYLDPFDKPKSKEIKIKESKSYNKEKEERHGRNLGTKEESMSKGWK